MWRLGLDVQKVLKNCLEAIFALIAWAAVNPVVAADAEPIRLWKITPHPGTTVFILGISHFGSRLEQDAYFQRAVLPAFAKSDVLHVEGGERTLIERLPACREPLRGRDLAVVEEARDLLRRGAAPYFRTILADIPGGPPSEDVIQQNAALYVRDVSEFGLLLMLRLQYQFLKETSDRGAAEVLPVPVVKLLLQARPNIDIRSVDKPDDLWSAYCESSTRVDVLKWHIENFDPNRPPEQATLIDAAGQVEEVARRVFVDGHTDPNPFLDMFVCPRNERWLPRLLSLDDGKTHFEALGAAHLFSYEGGSRRCDGLLQDLRRMGVEVTPVQ